jgi:hypothetical protein
MLVGSGGPTFEPSPVAGVWRFEKELDARADGSAVALSPEHGYEGN